MRLIADDQVPIRDLELCLHFLVTGQLVQAGNAVVDLVEYVAGHRGLEAVVRQDFKSKVEFLIEFVLPLLGQIAGGYDQAALQIAANDQLFEQQACHDGFTCARIIR